MKMNVPKIIAVIPARLEASRFPRKLLQDLGGQPVIVRTYEATLNTGLFDEVWVATDAEEIYTLMKTKTNHVFMSQKEHSCGSDRIAEAVQNIEASIVVNVQGDEPFTNKESLAKLLHVFEEDKEGRIDLASLMTPLKNLEDVHNPNNVKVITDKENLALYFSRSPIPYHRDESINVTYFRHIGIYAFRKQALLDFYTQPMTPLESAEKIECIRYLENGKRLKMVEVDEISVGIDTPEDLEEAQKLWNKP
jgi:3-deoxy-D-manno-octulosonate cytidylyltransferase